MFVVMCKLVKWWPRLARAVRSLTFFQAYALLLGGQTRQAKRRLIRLLELAASYNDKGICWRNDSPAQTRQTREAWQREIDTLLAEIGESSLPAELLAALRSGAAVCDDSGRFVEQARHWMPAGG